MTDRPSIARRELLLPTTLVTLVLLQVPARLSAEPEGKRTPLPDAAAQAQAEKLVQEVFQEEFARARNEPGDVRKLATMLREHARETKDDQAARFVLFRDAAELAAQAGDIRSAMNWVNELAREYIVDATEMQVHVLEAAGKSVATAEANLKLAEVALSTLDDALAADNFDVAGRLVAVVETAARSAKNVPLLKRAEVRSKEVRDLIHSYEPVKAAVEVLRQQPDDAEANLTVGRFSCFIRDNWEKGLAHLTKGSHAELRALAAKDLAHPADVREQVSIADGWWGLADSEPAEARPALRQRAYYWYDLAAPNVSGLTKAKVEKRLKALVLLQANLGSGEFRQWDGQFAYVGNIAFSPDGQRVLAAGTLRKDGDRAVETSAFARDLGDVGAVIIEWELRSGKEMRRWSLDAVRGQPAFSLGAHRALSGGGDNAVHLYDMVGGQELRRLTTPTAILQVAWSPDGRHAFLGGSFKAPEIYLWDLVADREVRRLESHEMNVQRLAFAPDGRRALAAGRYGDLALHLWDVESGQEIRRFLGHSETPQGVAFSADGRHVISGAEDKTIRVWDVETGHVERVLEGHSTPVWCVAISPDGKRALSGGGYARVNGGHPEIKDGRPLFDDCTVRLWDLETGHEICRFEGHMSYVCAVAFSPDGRYAASGCGDKTIRVWRLPR